MTPTDAVRRAGTLWGWSRFLYVVVEPDSSARVTVAPVHHWPLADWERSHHELDAEGRVTCHADCQSRDRRR